MNPERADDPSSGRPASRRHTMAQSLSSADVPEALKPLCLPLPLALLLFGCLLTFACGITPLLGPVAVAYRRYVPHFLLLFVMVAVAQKVREATSNDRLRVWLEVRSALPLTIGFFALIGAHHLVSNGINYAQMATDYWNSDPFNSVSRRIGMPVLSHVLGLDHDAYPVFWYAVLISAICMARIYMQRKNLLAIEQLSILSSSIFAYWLIGPGYSEVLVVLLGLYCLLVRPSLPERIIVAALMVATHETATVFIAAVLIMEEAAEDRIRWLAIFAVLYTAYAGSFILNWGADLPQALATTGKPNPGEAESTLDWLQAYPGRAVLGVAVAYKLYWFPVLARLRSRNFNGRRAGGVLLSLILVPLGTDTSRLVQFSSLALIVFLSSVLSEWSLAKRRLIAWLNVAVPSVYISINAAPLWGNGFYRLYLQAAQFAGLDWGRVFYK